jgi:GNAT superfamily N-acetyltransferase
VSVGPTKQLDSYELHASEMTLDDVPKLHELSVAVSWPHRAEDWAFVIGVGEGIVARDEIGRVVGSAMWFPVGEAFASVGMVITSPRLQEHGAGRWLMAHVFDRLGKRGTVLNATRAAYRLYISLGFQPLSPVYQHNGVLTGLPRASAGARPMRPDDEAAIRALDTTAIGAARPAVLERLFEVSTGTVIDEGGRLRGFALSRPFGRGHVVGPIVAETEEDAIALVVPHLAPLQGQFVRVDTRQPGGPFRDFLVAAGMRHYDTVTRMGFGRRLQPSGPAITIGLVNQALG